MEQTLAGIYKICEIAQKGLIAKSGNYLHSASEDKLTYDTLEKIKKELRENYCLECGWPLGSDDCKHPMQLESIYKEYFEACESLEEAIAQGYIGPPATPLEAAIRDLGDSKPRDEVMQRAIRAREEAYKASGRERIV